MLDKQSKKILKYVISKYSGNMETDIPIIPEELDLDYTEVNAACLNLYSLGYFSDFTQSYFKNDTIKVLLSHNGLHYFEIQRKNIFFICLKNIWMPITVSVITKAVITLIKYLLPLIQQWLSSSP